MDDINRVKNIKQKFEGSSHSNTQFKDSTTSSDDIACFKASSTKAAINHEAYMNHRANIKRTPAFRKDKVNVRNVDKNDYISKSADSLVTSRVHLFNKLDDVKDTSNNVKREFEDIKENKPMKFESLTNLNVDKLRQQNISELKQYMNQKPNSGKRDSLEAQYSKVDKSPKKLSKSSKKPNEVPVVKQPDSLYFLSKQRSVPSIANKSDIHEELSDTLKRVLSAPLPPGPPPKKPPRTFISSGVAETLNGSKIADSRLCGNYGRINNSPEDRNDKMPKLLRSKTESEIMLQKIENALLKHRENTFAVKEGNNKIDIKEKSPDKGQDMIKKHDANMSCFGSASHCASPSDNDMYTKNTTNTCFKPSNVAISSRNSLNHHIYEDPDLIVNTSIGQGAADSKLYYMSTPIETIMNSSELARLNETESDNKSIKNIADIFDKPDHGQDRKISTTVFDDPSIESKIKYWMNEAYGKSLKRSGAGDDPDLGISNDEIDGSEKECHHAAQCDQVTLLRKGYVQKIALKAVSRQQSILAQFSDYKHLFECLLLIGLNLDTSNNKVPYIKMKYPANTNVPQCIEHLCFPDAHEWSNELEVDSAEDDQNISNRYYTVTVTTEDGQRKYVYCIRLRPEGESALLPLSYCVLSSHKANEFFFRILEEVEARHGKTEVEFFTFLRELYETRFPTLGGGIAVLSSVEEPIEDGNEVVIKRSSDSRLEDLNLARTLEFMKVNVFLLIFSSMLLERKVILLSSSISKLSSCIEGLQTSLLPFEWQHTLITVVPSIVISISDLCEAPTPYLIGLLKPVDISQILPTMNNIQQVIVVDIDDQKVLKKVGDEQSIVPKHLTMGLKNALQLAHSSETATNNLLACEAFTRLFVELLNNYRRYIIRGNLDQRMTIQKEAFLRSTTTHSIRMFLEWFVETAAFSAFIETHSYSTESRKLFEKRLSEYENELNKLKHAKNNKMLKTVKQIGDFFKDLTIAP